MSIEMEYRTNIAQLKEKISKKEDKINLNSQYIISINLAPLNSCNLLRELRLNGNYLGRIDLTPLSSCISLELLDFESNKLQTIDLDPLSSCTRLQHLNLADNHLQTTNLTPLGSCTALEFLELRENLLQTIDLGPLSSCTGLRHLNLGYNQLQAIDLTPLRSCTGLLNLNLGENLLQTIDLSPLSSCTNLRHLNLGHNKLQTINLTPLSPCTGLETLDLGENQLMSIDLTPLRSCSNLRYLNLGHRLRIRTHIPDEMQKIMNTPPPIEHLRKSFANTESLETVRARGPVEIKCDECNTTLHHYPEYKSSNVPCGICGRMIHLPRYLPKDSSTSSSQKEKTFRTEGISKENKEKMELPPVNKESFVKHLYKLYRTHPFEFTVHTEFRRDIDRIIVDWWGVYIIRLNRNKNGQISISIVSEKPTEVGPAETHVELPPPWYGTLNLWYIDPKKFELHWEATYDRITVRKKENIRMPIGSIGIIPDSPMSETDYGVHYGNKFFYFLAYPNGLVPIAKSKAIEVLTNQLLDRMVEVQYIPAKVKMKKKYDTGRIDFELGYYGSELKRLSFTLKVTQALLDSKNMEIKL